MQMQHVAFSEAAQSAEKPAVDVLIDENMSTNDAAKFIMSEFSELQKETDPVQTPAQPQALDDVDDFDKSLSGSLEFKHEVEVNRQVEAENSGNKQIADIQLPGAEFSKNDDVLEVYEQFLQRMDEFFTVEQTQNEIQNQRFEDAIAQKEFDEDRLYKFLDLKFSETEQELEQTAKPLGLSTSKQEEVSAAHEQVPETRDVFANPAVRKHEIIKKEDSMVHRNEGFKNAVIHKSKSVECSQVEEIVLKQRNHKKHEKKREKSMHKNSSHERIAQPFYPEEFEPLQMMFPYVPFYGQIEPVQPQAEPQVPAQNAELPQETSHRPQMVNEFTSYHEPEQRHRKEKSIVEQEEFKQSIQSETQRESGPKSSETKNVQQTKQTPAEKNKRQPPAKRDSSPHAPEDCTQSTSLYSHTSLGEIFPKYDGKQADLMCKQGMGIGAYENSVFSDWNLSELYSSQLSDGELRRNFAHVQNYNAGK